MSQKCQKLPLDLDARNILTARDDDVLGAVLSANLVAARPQEVSLFTSTDILNSGLYWAASGAGKKPVMMTRMAANLAVIPVPWCGLTAGPIGSPMWRIGSRCWTSSCVAALILNHNLAITTCSPGVTTCSSRVKKAAAADAQSPRLLADRQICFLDGAAERAPCSPLTVAGAAITSLRTGPHKRAAPGRTAGCEQEQGEESGDLHA
jgi:hypothetical protein